MKPQKLFFKRWIRVLRDIFIISTITVVALEIGLRFINTRPENTEKYSGKWLEKHDHWGVWHWRNAKAKHAKSCFEVNYSANSFGMRDPERNLSSSKYRIAVLGDSMVEGYAVNDHETFTRIMEEQFFKNNVEVLNFGSSGNFGTVQQWLLYKHLVRKMSPDLVILFLFTANDLKDNNLDYQKRIGFKNYWVRPYLTRSEDGQFDLTYYDWGQPASEKKSGAAKEKKRTSHASFRLGRFIKNRILLYPALKAEFRLTPNADIKYSWEVTRKAIELLKEEVERDNAKLIIMDIPHSVQISKIHFWRLQIAKNFDPLYPNKRAMQIADDLNIPYYSLYDDFVEYRDSHNLTSPYFSHSCDPHWKALGHQVAADSVARYLIKNKYVSVAQK